jgi:hypothetical protein
MDDKQDVVRLAGPGDWKVRRRWHAGIFVLFTKDGTLMPGAEASADIEMEGTVARATSIHLEGFHPGSIHFDDLAEVDWERSVEETVLIEAANQRLRSMSPAEQHAREEAVRDLSPHELTRRIERGSEEVRRAVRAANRKNGVTRERLEEVIRLFDEGGIEAVTKELSRSRSYAYQLLARAREELQ